MTKSNKKRKNGIIAIVLICFIAGICAGIGFCHYRNLKAEEDALSASTEPFSESRTAAKSSDTALTDTTEQSTEKNSNNHETDTSATKQAKGYSLPLSINQALNALEEHYGSGYNISSTVEEDGYNYFAVYSGEEKYASVKVDLSTGEATETIVSTGKITDYYLV